MAALFRRRGPSKSLRKMRATSHDSDENEETEQFENQATASTENGEIFSGLAVVDEKVGATIGEEAALHGVSKEGGEAAATTRETMPVKASLGSKREGGVASGLYRPTPAGSSSIRLPVSEEHSDDDAAFIVRKSKASKALSRSKRRQNVPSSVHGHGTHHLRTNTMNEMERFEGSDGTAVVEEHRNPIGLNYLEKAPLISTTTATPGLTVTLKTTHATGPSNKRIEEETSGILDMHTSKSRSHASESNSENVKPHFEIPQHSIESMKQCGASKSKGHSPLVLTISDTSEEHEDEADSTQQLVQLARQQRERARATSGISNMFDKEMDRFSPSPEHGVYDSHKAAMGTTGGENDIIDPVERLRKQLEGAKHSSLRGASLQNECIEEDESTLMAAENEWEMNQLSKGSGGVVPLSTTSNTTGAQRYELQDIVSALNELSDPDSIALEAPKFSTVEKTQSYDDEVYTTVKAFEEELVRLMELRESNAIEVGEATHQSADAADEIAKLEEKQKVLEKTISDMEPFIDYFENMSGFLAAKIEPIKKASETLRCMEKEVWETIWNRKLQDVIDEYSIPGVVDTNVINVEELDEFGRSKAYNLSLTREQRASRRRRRLNKRMNEVETALWCTSDEDSDVESLRRSTITDREAFNAAALEIMSDAQETYSNVYTVVQHLNEFRNLFNEQYKRTFTVENLVELLSPFVEWHMLWWDPLYLTSNVNEVNEGVVQRGMQHGTTLETFDWYQAVMKLLIEEPEEKKESNYVVKDDEASGGDCLISLAQTVVFERVKEWIRLWNVLSSQQTKRLSLVLHEMLIFREANSLEAIQKLLEALVKRMEEGIEGILCTSEGLSLSQELRHQYILRGVKMASNFVLLQGVLRQQALSHIVLNLVYEQRLKPLLEEVTATNFEVLERFLQCIPQEWSLNVYPSALKHSFSIIERYQQNANILRIHNREKRINRLLLKFKPI